MSAPSNSNTQSLADRLSIYGSTTGTISVVNDVLELVNKARQTIGAIHHFDQSFTTYLIQFSREIARLEVWSQSLGVKMDAHGRFQKLSDNAFDHSGPTKTRAIIAQELTFSLIGSLLENLLSGFEVIIDPDLAKVESFLKHLERSSPSILISGTDPESTASAKLRSMEDLWAELRRLELVRDAPTVKGKLREVLLASHQPIVVMLNDLGLEVDKLGAFVGYQKLDALMGIVPSCLTNINLVKSKQLLIEQSVQGVDTKLDRLQQAVSKLTSLRQAASSQDTFVQEATRKAIYALQDHKDLTNPDSHGERILGAQLVYCERLPRHREVVMYKDRLHLVEWNEELVVMSDDENDRVQQRLGGLVGALGFGVSSLRILKTAGYVKDDQSHQLRFGLLYGLPLEYNLDSHKIKSLRQLFASPPSCLCDCSNCRNCTKGRSAPPDEIEMPTPGHRIRMATTLLRAFRDFQVSHWFHQGISSDNIIFIYNDVPKLNEPWITGFGFSRHASGDSDQRQPGSLDDHYQHPKRRQQKTDGSALHRYQAEFDIYSIGRLMVAIAVWEEVEDSSLDGTLTWMRSLVGTRYTDAAEWCLGKSHDSPIREENLRPSETPDLGGWPEKLIRDFDFKVLFKVADIHS